MGEIQHPHLSYQAAEQMGLPTLNNLVFLGTENGTLLWTPKLLEPFTLEILASSDQGSLSSVLKPRTVVCECKAESQCLYNQTSWVNNSSLEVSVRQQNRGGFPVGGKGSRNGKNVVLQPLCVRCVLGVG